MPLYDETGTTTYRPPPAIPRVNLTAPPEEQTPYTTWRQEEYLPQDRAQPVWAVEDRIVYLREQQRQRELQRQEEERRRTDLLYNLQRTTVEQLQGMRQFQGALLPLEGIQQEAEKFYRWKWGIPEGEPMPEVTPGLVKQWYDAQQKSGVPEQIWEDVSPVVGPVLGAVSLPARKIGQFVEGALYRPAEQAWLAARQGGLTDQNKQAILKSVVESPATGWLASEEQKRQAAGTKELTPADKLDRLAHSAVDVARLEMEGILDPLNLLPVLGFTEMSDLARVAGRLAAVARTPAARGVLERIAAAAKSETGQAVIRALRSPEGERGAMLLPSFGTGGRSVLRGETVEAPVTAVDRLRQSLQAARKNVKEQKALTHAELAARSTKIGEALARTEGLEAGPAAAREMRGWGEASRTDYRPPILVTEADGIELANMAKAAPLPNYSKMRALLTLNDIREGKPLQANQIKLMEKIYGSGLVEELMKVRRDFGAAVYNEIVGALNIPRAILASFDLSAPLRQGFVLTIAHPKEAWQSTKEMLKAVASENAAKAAEDLWITSPNAEFYDVSNLFNAARVGKLSSSEEAFMTRLAQRIPIIGPGVKASERAYVTYLNEIRRRTFDTVIANWQRPTDTGVMRFLRDSDVEITPQRLQQLGSFLNHATGRGDLGPLRELGPALNALFFSPRLIISRVQLPADLFMTNGPVRKLVARDLVASVGTGIAVLSLLKVSGAADVELDPRSTDFGKVRIGKRRWDYWAGFQPIARYTAQLISGDRKTIDPATGKAIFVNAGRLDTVGRFIQSKLAPGPGLFVDIARGKTLMGDELSTKPGVIKTQVFNRLVPLFIQDMVESVREVGPLGAVTAIPSAFGVGVQTYQTASEAEHSFIEQVKPRLSEEDRRLLDAGIIPGAIRAMPEWKQLRQEKGVVSTFDDLRERQAKGVGELSRQYQAGTLNIADWRKQTGDLIGDLAVEWDLELKKGGFKGEPREGDAGIIDNYFLAIAPATNADTHVTDFDKQDELERVYRAKLTPDQNKMLDAVLLYDSDPLRREYKKDRAQLDESGYFQRRETIFQDFKQRILDGPASEDVKAQVQGAKNADELQQALMGDMQQRGVARELYDKHPLWNAWEGFFSKLSFKWLNEHPEDDFLALAWGYQTRLHSREAGDLYRQWVGNPDVVPPFAESP